MNNRIRWFAAMAMTGLLLGCTSANGHPSPTKDTRAAELIAPSLKLPSSENLERAHKAYLEGDFVAFGERIRDVLLDPTSSSLVKENAYALLDKGYTVQGGSLPSAFKPPPGYERLQYLVRRFATPHGSRYQIRFAGVTRDASHLAGVTVRRLPNKTLMDKKTGKGTYEVRHDAAARSQGMEEFVIDSEALDVAPDDGVISLCMELDDGTVAEGFVIAHALVPPQVPEIISPAASAVVSDPNPIVRWKRSLTSYTVPFENHRMVLHLAREGNDGSIWEYAVGNESETTDVRIGAANGSAKLTLAAGNYWLFVSAGEMRSFGPVEMIRASRVSRPIAVAR